MQSFGDFLRAKENIPDPYVPHYLRWAAMYQRHAAEEAPGSTEQEILTSFLAYLARCYQDWQVQQARRAAQLWIYFSRTQATKLQHTTSNTTFPPARPEAGSRIDPPQTTSFPPSLQPDPPARLSLTETLSLEATRLMRLKHLSYRTEKSYLAWIARFLAFAAPAASLALTEEHLKHYLS